MKQLLSDAELKLNQQASTIAAAVLSEPVEAATRCEQVNSDMRLEAAGAGAINRGLVRGMKKMNRAMMPSVGGMAKEIESAGLPQNFILAVTAGKVVVLEDKHDGDKLLAGQVLKSWDREGFQARRGDDRMNAANGVPADRQVLTILIPIEGGKGRYQQAMAQNTAAAGSAGMPHKVMLAKDAASVAVVDALASKSALPNVMFGGQSLQDMVAQAGAGAAAAADPAEQLTKLAALHERGVLTDEEFAAQKAKILGT